jgi:NAD+ kinase
MRVGIVAQRGNDRAAALAAEVAGVCREDGVAVALDEATASALDEPGAPADEFPDCDLVVSIGGDGTFLFAARSAGTTPVLGVNLGEVGFLNAVAPGEAVEAVEAIVAAFRETGAVPAREVTRLRARGDDGWRLAPALNEVVVQGTQRGHGRGLDVEVRVDGERYAETHADGALVATPTGSTAYNLSEDGPLVHPSVDGLLVTLMCPADPRPSLVVPPDSEVTLRIAGAESAVVASDGRDQRSLDPPTEVAVTRDEESARVAGPGREFFAALSKLE